MNPITYIKLKISEWWYDWFERQSKYVWDRSAERRELAAKQAQEVAYKINSGLNLSPQYYSNSVIGNSSTLNLSQISPLTASQIGQINTIQPYTYNPQNSTLGTLQMNDEISQSQPIQFTVHHANGGKVVEYIVNDGTTRRTKLHVITPDQDLGHELGKIITLELLRN